MDRIEKEKTRLEMNVLLESSPLLKQLINNIKQVVWIIDPRADHILYISPSFETVWGRSCESLYADPLSLIKSVHPEDRVKVISASPDDIRKSTDQTYRILRPDGSLRWISAHTFLIGKQSSDTSYQVCIAQDITEHNRVEQHLREALESSREQFDFSHKMSLTRKPEAVLKTLMSVNEFQPARRAALFLFDNPKSGPAQGVELMASWQYNHNVSPWMNESNLYEEPVLWELAQPNQAVVITEISSDSRLTASVRDLLLDGQNQTLVIFPLVASGNWHGCLLVYYEKEQYLDYAKLRHLKVLIDQASITLYNLKLLDVEEKLRHDAERANEIKTEFLAMISHELRTPLTSIIGFTTTLLADDVTWKPNEQTDFIQTIQQEAFRLQELIDHLLDLSRLEAGMLPIIMKPHSLHEILQDALPQLKTLTKEQTLTVHFPDRLPLVLIDSKRIAQVLVNLVQNASIYAPKGTEINISAVLRGGFVQVNVKDMGPGIPLADHKKVFKAFLRGQNEENGATKGAGLGLAICKGLIEAHNGRIWIKKKSTIGTTVSFTVPIVPTQAPIMPAQEE